MFEEFESHTVVVDGIAIHAVIGGSGPPVLLLHGYPQMHAMWHHIAPELARRHTVVVADLRGYGDSAKPAGDTDHATYSKRAMAADQVGLMRLLGFESFAVVGHDRGARVAHRMCLDHPDRVNRVAVLDIVPTRHMFRTADSGVAHGYYHWFFLAQPFDLPERLIGADPEYFLRYCMDRWAADSGAFAPEAVAEYLRCFADPATIHATCEDYRAAATVDLEHDEADARAGRRVGCPVLALWGGLGFVGTQYDAAAIWRQYTADVQPEALPCGHFLPEEAPEATAGALIDFLAPGRSR